MLASRIDRRLSFIATKIGLQKNQKGIPKPISRLKSVGELTKNALNKCLL